MRVIFAGTPELAVPTLERLCTSEHHVVGVLTRADAPAGRGKRLAASPVASAAEALGIEVAKPERLDEGTREWITELRPDIVVVVAYGRLVPQDMLDVPTHGWINLHFSDLPAWRGAAPVQRSIMAGEQTTAACVFQLVEELDAGPIHQVQRTDLGDDETAGEVLTRLADVGVEVVLRALGGIEDGAPPSPQPSEGVSHAPKITVEDARINWGSTAADIHNLVRGCSPAPGAWTTLDGERFKITHTSHPAAALPDQPLLRPGALYATRRDLLVGTAEGLLRLKVVQPHGRKPMPGADWARGVLISDGMSLS